MRVLRTWACAAVLAAASPAVAQQTTGTTAGTGGINSGGSTLGSSSLGSSSLGSSSLGSSSLGGGSLGGGTGNSAGGGLDALSQQNAQFSNIGITSSSSLQRSNVFSQFYANPYALGLSTSAGSGGFGQPLYGASTTGARGGAGTTGRTGTTGRAGGLNSTANQSGILIPLPAQIAYQAQMRFPTAPEPPARLQAELRRTIDAGGLAAPAGVQVLIDANNNVTLRGVVKDDDEARLTEGLVRLTPGVQAIVNELTYPAAPK